VCHSKRDKTTARHHQATFKRKSTQLTHSRSDAFCDDTDSCLVPMHNSTLPEAAPTGDRHFDSDERIITDLDGPRRSRDSSSKEVRSTDHSYRPVKREVDQLLRRWNKRRECRWFWNLHCFKDFWHSESSQAERFGNAKQLPKLSLWAQF